MAAPSKKKPTKKTVKKAPQSKLTRVVKRPIAAIRTKTTEFMARRPHRSFRLTRRRDYARSLDMPGYRAFTKEVHKTMWGYRKIFIWLVLFYAVALLVTVGITSQDNLTSLTDSLRDSGSQILKGDFSGVGDAGLLVTAITTTGLSNDSLTESQQVYTVILGLLIWLTTVWLLRNLLAGHKVKMRDGLYSAGSPIVATFLLTVVLLVQLLPFALALIAYSAASSTGLLNGGVEAMLFWIGASLLTVISLYWVTSTLFAMVIVTLPGMYPMNALRIAGDMIIGRRIRVLLRIIWMIGCVVIGWIIVMVPVVLLDTIIKGIWSQIEWVPIVPAAALILSPFTIVWAAGYIYLLYRKVVDDETDPA